MTRSLVNTTALLSLTTTVKNFIDATGQSVSTPVKITKTHNLASGTESAEADRAVEHQVDITAGNTVVIDLADFVGTDVGAGDGNDALGLPLVLHQIVAIAIVNQNAIDTDGLLEIEPDVTNGWTALGSHTVALGGALPAQGSVSKIIPGAIALEVADGSTHRLALTAVDDDVDCRIVIFGRSEPPASSSSSSSSGI